jgi:arachidonate 15-lipoxygenase
MALLEIIGRSKNVVAPSRPASVEGYLGLFTLLDPPWFAKRMGSTLDDDTFAWMRVAGPNPLVIEGVAGVDAGFPVTEAHYRTAMHDDEDSLARAGAEGRLYLADYAVLAGMESGVTGYRKFCCAPKALFALPRGAGVRRLKPVAIQCGQDAAAFEIFTPADGEGWLKAKLVVQSADSNHHELISHLARTHLLIGAIVVCTRRQLDDDHPVSRLLVPHFEGTLSINDTARTGLLSKGGGVDRAMAGTIEASVALAGAAFAAPYFNHGFLPRWLAARRLLGAELEYPYRDDALLVWGAIERWVESYLRLHYATDAEVAADEALARWAAEIVARDGGRVAAFGEDGAGRIHTLAYLIQALTMIVFTASAQHAVVNFAQAELMTLASTTPGALATPAPRTRAEGAQGSWADMLALLDAALFQLEFLNLLGGVHYTQLGQYPSHGFGDRERDALARFQHELTAIGAEIGARNETRLGPFTPLIPSGIPQSINI